MHFLLLFVTLGGVLGGLTDPRTQYSAFRDMRLQTSYVVDYKQTPTLCQCVTSCRTSATCYGVAYGPMYATSATLATGTSGVCHIATQPQVPSGLVNYTGYTALIRGRVDSGCDEILGYEKFGAAGCIWLSDVTLDRDSGQAACQARGGNLAVLDTTDKYDAVANRLLAIQPKPGHHWVDAYYTFNSRWLALATNDICDRTLGPGTASFHGGRSCHHEQRHELYASQPVGLSQVQLRVPDARQVVTQILVLLHLLIGVLTEL
ncbi:uncharacterized protein LOC108681984 [Hyalella azteca]|uniref:Uncharacterized protein LOC108681984 n=1 Tax=Hyalella azteca TaxID=294128 RepID=A0A8B7PKN5_HYAAZ|nr:uncharacterized protein LOC108681984 [Hyalella azteca]